MTKKDIRYADIEVKNFWITVADLRSAAASGEPLDTFLEELVGIGGWTKQTKLRQRCMALLAEYSADETEAEHRQRHMATLNHHIHEMEPDFA